MRAASPSESVGIPWPLVVTSALLVGSAAVAMPVVGAVVEVQWLVLVLLALLLGPAVALLVVAAVAMPAVAVVALLRVAHTAHRVLTATSVDEPDVRFPEDDPEPGDGPPERDPAFTSYYLEQVFVDVRQVFVACRGELADVAEHTAVAGIVRWLRTGEPATPAFPTLDGPVRHVGWLLSWPWVAGAVAGRAMAGLLGLAARNVLLLLLGVVAAFVFGVNLTSAAARRISVEVGRAPATCPYPTCKPFRVVPAYVCAGGERHYDLRPGRLGVWRRTCRCGRTLPTTRLGKRENLTPVCPQCGKELPSGLGSAPVRHILMVGATGAGKTALLTAILGVTEDRNLGRVVPLPGGEESFFATNLELLRRGEMPQKTRRMLPLLLELYPRRSQLSFRRRFVYFFDPGGEAFYRLNSPGEQLYLHHCNGMIFVMDVTPTLTLSASEETSTSRWKKADEPPVVVYNHICEYLDRNLACDGRRFPFPLAVVVPKFDILKDLRVGVGLQPGEVREEHRTIRSWLGQIDQQALLGKIRLDFLAHQFYAVSALHAVGPRDEASRCTDTEVVTRPLWWLLRHRARRPLRLRRRFRPASGPPRPGREGSP